MLVTRGWSRALLAAMGLCASATLWAAEPDSDGPEFTSIEPSRISAAEFAQMKAMFSTLDQGMKPSKVAPASAAHAMPEPRDLSKVEIAKVLGRLRGAFFFGMHMSDKVVVEGELFFVPNVERGVLTIEWSAVLGIDGKNLLRKPNAEEAEREKAFRRGAISVGDDGAKYEKELMLSTKDSDVPLSRAEGMARLKLPTAFTKLELTCAPGAKASVDGYTATLRRCENDVIEFDWTGKSWNPIEVVKDASGKRLDDSERDREPILRGGKTIAQIEYKDLPLPVEGARVRIKAKGKIASVSFFVPKAWSTEEIKVFATAEPKAESGKPLKIAAPRSFVEGKRSMGLAQLDAAKVKSQTQIIAARTYAVVDFNQPKVVVQLPRVDNSLYATMEFTDTKLISAKKKAVAFKPSSVWVSYPELSNEVRFEKASGDGIIEYARAKGKVKLRYPSKIHVVTLTQSAPEKDGMKATFDGARVTLTGEADDEQKAKPPSFAPPEFDVVRAYDSTGERLRALSGESWGEEGHTLAFWGEPKEVRVLVVDEWDQIDLSYDLAPAAMLPKDRAGLKP